MVDHPTTSNYIDGTAGTGNGPELPVIDPSTGEVLWTYPADTPETVDAAVDAAARAFPAWSRATPVDRSTVLHALAAELGTVAEDLAQAETAQCGKPIRLSREFDVPGSIDNVSFFAGAARDLEGKAAGEYSADHTSMIRREAIGVVGSVAPWNYTLQMAMWKILPAIAAGNTIVLKPAENTPLTTLMVAEACQRVGMPAGVVNIVNGLGPVTGEALVTSPKIGMTSFTGSTAAAGTSPVLRPVTGLACTSSSGGKAPFMVFDDADLDAAVYGTVAGALINTGQDCTAATRAYVHRSRFDDFVAAVAELMPRLRLGVPTDPDTDQGPLVVFQAAGPCRRDGRSGRDRGRQGGGGWPGARR